MLSSSLASTRICRHGIRLAAGARQFSRTGDRIADLSEGRKGVALVMYRAAAIIKNVR